MNPLVLSMFAAQLTAKNKGLNNQETMRAAMMGYVGSAMPGTAGIMLGTMSAVNEEALKNKLEVSEAARVTAQSVQGQAESDLNVLLQGNSLIHINAFANNGKPEGDLVREVLKRLGKWTAPATNGNSPATAPTTPVAKDGTTPVVIK